MAREIPISFTGNLTADPDLRFTSTGTPVTSFRVAVNHRHRDASGQWVDAGSTYLRCNAWRSMADNITNSLHKGDRVAIQGYLKQETYTATDGTERTTYTVECEDVAPSLKFAVSTPQKTTKNTSQGGGQGVPQGSWETNYSSYDQANPPF